MNIITDREFREFRARQESQYVTTASSFIDGAKNRLRNGVSHFGDPMPWSKTYDKFRFRPSEVTIWAGPNGSGKSLVSGQCALWLAKQTKVLIASLEMPGDATVARMARQYTRTKEPTDMAFDEFESFIDESVWLYDQVGSSDPESILAMIHWGAEKEGIKHFYLDSLMKMVRGTDDYNSQKDFVDSLCWAAKEHKIHIHLVHHVRKPGQGRHQITKYDIKGAGEITDLADNVILVSRNDADDGPACFLDVAKQRHAEWEGTFAFWFHEKSWQWISDEHQGAMTCG